MFAKGHKRAFSYLRHCFLRGVQSLVEPEMGLTVVGGYVPLI